MMSSVRSLDPIALLVDALDQAYDRKSWHGPNLKGSIRGLSSAAAAWRPAPGRHSIAEHILHTSYWKYTVRRRLRGERPGSFARKGHNWFPVPEDLQEPTWREMKMLLDAEHRALREAVAALEVQRLDEPLDSGSVSVLQVVQGIAAHDLYHAGQINLLKRLQNHGAVGEDSA